MSDAFIEANSLLTRSNALLDAPSCLPRSNAAVTQSGHGLLLAIGA